MGKHHSKEFINRAVQLCAESHRPIAAVARDIGVEYATLLLWMKKAGKTKGRAVAAAAAAAGTAPITPITLPAEAKP